MCLKKFAQCWDIERFERRWFGDGSIRWYEENIKLDGSTVNMFNSGGGGCYSQSQATFSEYPGHKLELCAFALKGEHTVYSLVPNKAVCMYIYIYIDQKWIYIKL